MIPFVWTFLFVCLFFMQDSAQSMSGWPLILEKLENTWKYLKKKLVLDYTGEFQISAVFQYNTWKRHWDILEYTGIFFIGHTFFITLSINFLNWLILLMDEICISIRMHFYALYLCIFIICPVWCHYSVYDLGTLTWLIILHLYLIILDFYPSKLLEFWFMYWNSVKLNTWKWKNILENVLEYTGIRSWILSGHPACAFSESFHWLNQHSISWNNIVKNLILTVRHFTVFELVS